MPEYRSVKITFDIEDDHQSQLYNFLKERSNGSSYIRTLLHHEMMSSSKKYEQPEEKPQIKFDESRYKIPEVEIINHQEYSNNPNEIILDGLF